jgi:hypothetical protein
MHLGVFIVYFIILVVYSNVIQCTYNTFQCILMYLKVFECILMYLLYILMHFNVLVVHLWCISMSLKVFESI